MQPRWGSKWRAGAVSSKMSKELFSVFRPSPKQLLHWCWWLPQTDARQWHGGGPADRAPSAGWHCQPHGGEEECHPAHWQWPQPRGVEAEEGASQRAGHCLWTSAEGKWERITSTFDLHFPSYQSPVSWQKGMGMICIVSSRHGAAGQRIGCLPSVT